jgi:hypothetical protein
VPEWDAEIAVVPARATSARPAFFAGYGEVDDATLLRAREIAIFLGCALLEYGVHEGVPAIEREARAALERTLSA